MDHCGPRGIQMFHDHFTASSSDGDASPSASSSITESYSRTRSRRKLKSTLSLLNLLSLRARSLRFGEKDQDKVVLSADEVRILRSKLAALDERESHCKAQVDHVNEILRSSRLSGYLFLRMRWATFPGEPPPVDDVEVDDWLPRFVVLHGSCIYLYMTSTEISPLDSTMLSDVIEVGPLPPLKREDEEARCCFYILTRYGLRYECSSSSQIQVDSWLAALQSECKLMPDPETCQPNQ